MNKQTAELLEQYFDTAFLAPNGIQKLRELILTLAMRGKLVPQDPSDAPASELLKEIEAEKKRLVKECRIKAPKPLPAITPEEIPVNLPDGWVWVRNGFLFGLRKGKVPNDLSETVGSIPYLDIEALDRRNIRRYTEDAKAPQSTDRDILVVCDGSRSGLVLDGKNGAIGSTLSVIETPLFIQPFVKLLFRQGYGRMNSSMKGAAIPHLDSKNLLLEVIGLPPLAEQKRILEKIDQLMARCDALENLRKERDKKRLATHTAALSQLLVTTSSGIADDAWAFISQHFDDLYAVKENVTELRKAILQLAVMGKLVSQDPNDPPASELLKEIEAKKKQLLKEGRIKAAKPLPEISLDEVPHALPESWEWVRLGSVAEIIGGFAYKSNLFKVDGTHQVLRLGNIRPNLVRVDENPVYIDEDLASQTDDFRVLENDILITMTGTREKRDYLYSVLVEQNPLNGKYLYLNQRVGAIRTYGLPRYFDKVLKVEALKDAIYSTATGSANQANIGISSLREWVLPVPPIPEQRRIIVKVDLLMSLCDRLEKCIESAAIRQSELLNAVMAEVLPCA